MRTRYRTVRSAPVIALLALAGAVVLGSQPPADPAPKPPAEQPPATEPSPEPPKPAPPPAPSPAPSPAPAVETPPPPQAGDANEAREAVVLLRDGQRYTGLLVSRDDEKVVLKIAGIDTPIPTSQIDRVSIMAPVLDRYRTMRGAIDDNDVDRLLMLVEWLRARSQWDPALNELDHILKVQPDHFDARRLKTLVVSQKKLAQAANAPKATRPVPKAAAPQPEVGDFPLLAEHDINLIKIYEVDLNDPPRMLVDRRTITRLMDEHAGDPAIPGTQDGREALYRQTPGRILETMFKVQARNLYGDVQVLDHPRAMRLFRDEVHRSWLINSCATSRCHGGPDAGRLKLFNKKSGTDPALYTNFLILDRFRLADGRALINYEEPAKSPLLQLGLPREGSLAPHPVVPAVEGHGDLWRPFFRSADDRRFQGAVEWIKAMYRPRPDYPVQYTPPAPSAPKPAAPPIQR